MTETDRTKRLSAVLNEFEWSLTAAFMTIMVWQKLEGDFKSEEVMKKAALHGVPMCFGTIGVTLRQFEDLWTQHLRQLLPQASEAHMQGQWIVEECRCRGLRNTTNKFFAHYAAGKSEWPLTAEEATHLL